GAEVRQRRWSSERAVGRPRGPVREPVHAVRRHAQGQPAELRRRGAARGRRAAVWALLRAARRRTRRVRSANGGRARQRRPGNTPRGDLTHAIVGFVRLCPTNPTTTPSGGAGSRFSCLIRACPRPEAEAILNQPLSYPNPFEVGPGPPFFRRGSGLKQSKTQLRNEIWTTFTGRSKTGWISWIPRSS